MIDLVRCAVLPHPERAGVQLVGEVDLSNRELLAQELAQVATQPSDVYIDVAGLTFIDVGGMTALATFAHDHDYRVVIEHPSPLLRRIFGEIWTDSELEFA